MDGIKSVLKHWLPAGSTGRWILSGIYSNPTQFLSRFLRSLKATHKLTGRYFPVKVRIGAGQKLDVFCSSKSNISIEGNVFVNRWGGSNLPSSVSCSDESTLRILGDFEMGPGVHITVGGGAKLTLGGRRDSMASGITCNSRILVEKNIEIGADCIIAWDVFITDSNWHDIQGSERCQPVSIGDNVWIAHGASVVKGAQVPSGCIVGAKSLVSRGNFPEKSLIAGVPATVRRTEVEWSR